MAIEVKHATAAIGTDAGNGEIGKTAWNESHDMTGTPDTMLGFDGSGNAAEFGNVAKLDGNQQFTGAAKGKRQVLGSQSTTVAWDMSLGPYGFTVTLTGNATISNPTNKPTLAAGDLLSGLLTISQDATGSRVPAWGTDFKNVPTLSTAANAVDAVAYVYDGTNFILGSKVTK